MKDFLGSGPRGVTPDPDPASPAADCAWRSIFVAACPAPLPARDRKADTAVKIVAWSIDECNVVHALAIRPDGTLHQVDLDELVFDHALRPTAY